MQDGHDFVIACFAILRADAVVVPVTPMNLTGALGHYLEDSDARVAITEEVNLSRLSETQPPEPRCRTGGQPQNPHFARAAAKTGLYLVLMLLVPGLLRRTAARPTQDGQ